MADLNDLTQNVNIWDDAKSKAVTVTTDGANERLDVQVKGEVSITSASESFPIQVQYNKAFAAVNANEWQEIAAYTVPTGYNLSVLSFRCHSETAGEDARVMIEKQAGTFNCPTNTFTDGSAFTAPQFGSGLYVLVTTAIPNILNDTVTVTYTNEKGVTGRTCVIEVTKSSAVGTAIEGVLQTGDLGISDVTNVTHSATGQEGALRVDIYYNVFNLIMTDSNIQYQAVSIAGNPVTIGEGEEIVMAVLAGTKTSYTRHLSLTGTLDPV